MHLMKVLKGGYKKGKDGEQEYPTAMATIPAEIRRSLGIEIGNYLEVTEENGAVVMRKYSAGSRQAISLNCSSLDMSVYRPVLPPFSALSVP